MSGEGHGGPKRGYTNTHAPFETGNLVALKHGAKSERIVEPLANEARARLLDLAPWLSSPTFAGSVAALARVEAKISLVDAWLDTVGGDLDEDGKPRPAAEFALRLEKLGADLRARLGLDPTACARIRRDLASGSLDLAAQLAAIDVDDEDGNDE